METESPDVVLVERSLLHFTTYAARLLLYIQGY